MMIRTIAVSAILGALLGGSALAQEKPALVFTAIPDQDETRLVERFTRVADYLRGKLSVPVRYLPVKSYPAAVAAFVNNQVQLAWFGGFTGVQARRQVPDSEAIAQGAEDLAFKSFFIANVRTGLKPSSGFPKDIAGKSFTFGSRASTSGRLMPEYFIRQQFGGRSPSKAGKIEPSQVSVIWESPTFPDYQWTVRGDVEKTYGTGFKQRLQDALLAVNDPAILNQFARTKFVPAKNSDYRPIEEVGQATNLLD